MTDDQPQLYNLTRRKVLAGLGAVGLASAGAGLGTSAFYQDIESLQASLNAGRVDLFMDFRATYKPWLDAETFNRRASVLLGENNAMPAGGFQQIPDADGNPTDAFAIGQAPDIRDGEGNLLGYDEWGDVVRSDAVLEFVCADREYDPADGSAGLDDALAADGYSLAGELNPNDRKGFVNGPEGFMFDLADVKPYDAGEATMSLHLCGNDSYIYLRPTGEQAENGRIEPEFSAGDMTVDAGELADYLHVNLWADRDCNNLKGDGTGKLDVVIVTDVSGSMLYPQNGSVVEDANGDTPSGYIDNSLRTPSTGDDAGFVGDDTYKIDVVQNAIDGFVADLKSSSPDVNVGTVFFGTTASGDDSSSTTGSDIAIDLAPDGTDRPGVRSTSLVDLDSMDPTATGNVLSSLREEIAAPGFTGTDLPNGLREAKAVLDAGGRPDATPVVIVLANGGTQQSEGPAAAEAAANDLKNDGARLVTIRIRSSAAILETIASQPKPDNFFDVPDLATGAPALSQVFDDIVGSVGSNEICLYEGSLAGLLELAGSFDNGEIPLAFDTLVEDGQLPGRECFEQGAYCYAFEWQLPCKPEDFLELGSFAVSEDVDEDGEVTFADELAAKGLPLDANVTQTDSASFGFEFRAEQCRHNMGGTPTSTGEGFVKQAEEFNGDSQRESAFARGRFGNNANNGAWEVGIGEPGSPTPQLADTANYVWTSGATVPFVYQADGSGNASFTLDGVTVDATGLPAANGRIGIQTKADDATIEVANLQLETDMVVALDGPTGVVSTNDGDGRSTNYLVIETAAADLANGYTISGDVTVTLQGDYPGGDEDVAFDVVVE
jgi:hypothetical protein